MMNDSSVLATMSPESKELYIKSLKKERKNMLAKLNEHNDKGEPKN
jgi:hypothetical protein